MHAVASPSYTELSPPPAQQPVSGLSELTHIALSLDALNCGAILVSRQGIVAHVNPRLCEMIQRSRASLVGSSLPDWYLADDGASVAHTLLENFDQSRETEFFLPLPSGGRMPVVVSARPVGADGLLSEYAVVTFIDLSQQKRAEARLIEQNDYIGQLSDQVIQQATMLREYTGTLEERVRQRTAELHEAHMETLFMLAIASEAKDEDTGWHVRRIRELVQALAIELGISATDAERIGHASVLHDVGKIHTPDLVLKKPGPLTCEEREKMQEHTLAGERILKPSVYFGEAARIARHHHENFDGTGYPDGLGRHRHPVRSPHRSPWPTCTTPSPTVACTRRPGHTTTPVAEIVSKRGTMFDPAVVDAFVPPRHRRAFAGRSGRRKFVIPPFARTVLTL